MKKTRITTKGDTIRRDSYYIDPVSGYAFRSIKDVDRYLESGEIGRNAFKPKDKDSSGMELEDDKLSSGGVTTEPTLSVRIGQSSNLDVIANDQQIPKPVCAGESAPMPGFEHISSQYQKEGKVGLAESTLVPICTNEDAQEKQLQESARAKHGTEKAQNHQHKYKHMKEINLPRRASKRLAGIKVDPLPELKTRSRTRRVVVKQSGEGETITNEDKSPDSLPNGVAKQVSALEGGSETKCKSDSATSTIESPKSGQSKHFYGKLSATEKLPEKTVEEHGGDKDQECFSFLPLKNLATLKEPVGVLDNGDKFDTKLDYSLDVPLGELLTDPCIAFAIQILTGVTFETPRDSQISSDLKNSKTSEALAAAEGHGQKMGDDKDGCNVFSAHENFAIPKEHAGDVETDDKGNENSVSSAEMPLDISWMDPCIKFAIKTLTGSGSLPLDPAPSPENCLQQQFSSSNTQRHCEMALSSVSLENIHQTDYYCSQYFGTQKPTFKHQSFVDPTLEHTRNVGIGNSAGARVPRCGEDRRNVWQR